MKLARSVMVFCFCLPAFAQDAPKKEADLTDGKEILKRADAAAKAVRVIKYNAVAKGLGADEAKRPTVEGSAFFGGWTSGAPARSIVECKVTKPGSTDVAEYVAGNDGETVYLVDFAAKTVYADMDAAVLGSAGRIIRSILLTKIVDPDAFKDELAAEKVELKGVTKIGDQDCYEIAVDYGPFNGEGVWFFSKTDFLPRRIDRFFPMPGGEKSGRQVILSDVVVNPRPPTDNVDPFALEVPEGFKKTDEFAP